MRFDVITLFPEMFGLFTESGVTRRAVQTAKVQLHTWNPRDFVKDAYRRVDDRPFGGGPGMVLMAQPLDLALDAIAEQGVLFQSQVAPVVYVSPAGRPLTHASVLELASLPALTILCGRYEGIDERLLEKRVNIEISIGDFVVSGGELPAMMLMDAVARQLPGVLNDAESAVQESFANGLLDCPHYTRPEIYQDQPVPAVLLSGNHAEIAHWRRVQALQRTLERRPDLIQRARSEGKLSKRDEAVLAQANPGLEQSGAQALF
jgi:tRNA (guanine37-N1)-methyltransferase